MAVCTMAVCTRKASVSGRRQVFRWTQRLAALLVLSLFGLVSACNRPGPLARQSATATSEEARPPVPGSPPVLPTGALDIPALVAKLKPVVVNVTVEHFVSAPSGRESGSPFDFFFGFPFGRGRPGPGGPGEGDTLQQTARGSGFLIDGSRVVTNAHVVEGADTVRVKLLDEREFKAKVKGRDEHLDVAVLELEGAKDLPAAALGSSDALQVGEYVLAIGNPFGLGHTVTLGIVSAKSRAIGAGPYDDFIQTDAAINPGNSGGPLFNLHGEVIGINTAIAAQGSGIGFAIPIDEAKGVIDQLVAKGTVERARLGVVVQGVDWPLSRALGMDRPHGALVASVESGSPADKAGLQPKDVIVGVDGRKIESWQELPRIVASHAPNSRVKLEILRGKTTRTVEVTLGRLESEQASTAGGKQTAHPAESLGVTVEDAPDGGAAVRHVDVTRPAGSVLSAGDVITEVDGKEVKTAADFQRLVQQDSTTAPLLLKVRRQGQSRYVAIER